MLSAYSQKCAIVDYMNATGSGWLSTLELSMNNSELRYNFDCSSCRHNWQMFWGPCV